jgi:SAM-dependent methyltransferase/3-polyprenyl-4-hydroxybenzoate decarboxylase
MPTYNAGVPTADPEIRIRAPIVRVIDHADSVTVISPSGTARTFTGDSAGFVRAVIEIHAKPVTGGQLIAELSRRAEADVPANVVDEVIDLLVQDGVLVRHARAVPVTPVFASRRVVVCITGAIAAVDGPAIVRGLYALGCDVRIALTRAARKFVAVEALEAITHHQVWRGMWQRDARTPVPHINLAEWAELVLVCPASATSIARIASGDCSDLVSAIVAATRAPVVVVPSMNDGMFESPAVQDNLETLREHGRRIVHPAHGVEVAHDPHARRALLGPAPPPQVIIEIVRHVLAEIAPHPRLPADPDAWERLWSTTATAHLPWHGDALDAPLAAALDARKVSGRRLVDLGTGAGTVAIEAARRGFTVTATDVAPTALGRARERAGELPIVWVLDDVTACRLPGPFDVAVDRGLLHCLPRDRWPAYAAAVTNVIAPGGSLLLVAHEPGGELATTPVTDADVRGLLSSFELVRSVPSTLSNHGARLFELERRASGA